MQSWTFVFHLVSAGEIDGDILFRLRVLSSFRILLMATEGEEPTLQWVFRERCNNDFGGILFYCVVGLVLPHFVRLSYKT
jgi:hypothetical protein